MLNENLIYVSGIYNNQLIKSIDGGDTWQREEIGTYNGINQLASAEGRIFACGENVIIRKTKPAIIDNITKEEIPITYELMQNYPNPFNPSTIIKFALPESGKVTLSIYNILGEKVADLINKEMEEGYHEIKWDASHLSSGMYIYTISTGKFRDIKKMLLLK